MKKGFVYSGITQDLVTKLNISWCYNWNTTQPYGLSIPYTPMFWSGKNVTETNIFLLKNQIINQDYVLLGFNEPDYIQQSNMTVDQAISLWPQLQQTGRRLGSPATAGNPSKPDSWLSNFMTQAKANNYKVDFICMHWYAPPNALSFLNKIDLLYQQYNLPIWITEFSPADWNATLLTPTKYTQEDAINFMNIVLPELENRPYVERYTWKTRSITDINLGFAALFNIDGTLTPVGEAYSVF